MIPLSLYIHVPWCVSKCPYCDFNSVAGRKIDSNAYLAALIKEFDRKQDQIQDRQIISVFIGGGTPSLLAGDFYARLLAKTRPFLAKNAEITIEANPESLTGRKLNAYLAAGINRLSIGVQSFSAANLQILKRAHTVHQAIKAISAARKEGFDNINLDLMFALPHASELDDLQTAIELSPAHISWYQLTIEPETQFYHNPPPLPDSDETYVRQRQGMDLLGKNGFFRYEISAYGREKPCSHNLNYWRFGDYIGIGAGAHGKNTALATNMVTRTENPPNPQGYIKGGGSSRLVNTSDLVFEFMLNSLRLTGGFSLNNFSRRTGVPASAIAGKIALAAKQGLIEQVEERVIPTKRGLDFLNDLTAIFLPAT